MERRRAHTVVHCVSIQTLERLTYGRPRHMYNGKNLLVVLRLSRLCQSAPFCLILTLEVHVSS